MPFDAGAPSSAMPPAPPFAMPPYHPPTIVDVGTLVGHVFAVWKKHMWLFAGYTLAMVLPAIVVAVAAVTGVIFTGTDGADPDPMAVISMIAVVFPLVMVVVLVDMGGLTYGAIQSMADRPVVFGTMFSVAFRRLFLMIAAGFVAGVLVSLGLVLLLVPGIIALCGLSVVIPVVVAERLGPIEAVKRAWSLTSGYKGTIFGTAVVLWFVSLGLNLVAAVIGLIPILGTIASLMIQLLAASLTTIWPAVAYHDLRVAKEGVATDDLARVFE